jgi:hypothetical protein
MVPRIGNGPAIWYYSNVDAHTDVDAVGYFTDGNERGLRLNDIMFVVDTDTATLTIHRVLSGGLTIGASGA